MEIERSTAQRVAAARSRIENLSPDQVLTEMHSGSAILIDIREPDERRQTGFLQGSHHVPRGLLEFQADPASPLHRKEFERESRIILISESGMRSALATETLLRMGFAHVAHLDGGIRAWIGQGLPIEKSWH